MSAIHKRIARTAKKASSTVVSVLRCECSSSVEAIFYNHETRTLRVIYGSGAGYDYYGVSLHDAQLVKLMSHDPKADIRESLKASYKRERLDSKVSKALQLAAKVQQEMTSGLMRL